MQADATLTLDLTSSIEESRRLAGSIKPGTGRWDVIVVGSGAAGGMAAYQLAMAGVEVLLLEAGRMIDTRKEYRTMEWPYASMRRNRLPPGERPLAVAEYAFLDRPYGANPALAKHAKVMSYAANTFTRNWVVDEKEHPTTGTPYAWVRARILGGRTNFWGRGALRYGPLQFNAASRDGFDDRGYVTTEVPGGDAAYLKDLAIRVDRFLAGQKPVEPQLYLGRAQMP